jgi:hypothetical protein
LVPAEKQKIKLRVLRRTRSKTLKIESTFGSYLEVQEAFRRAFSK